MSTELGLYWAQHVRDEAVNTARWCSRFDDRARDIGKLTGLLWADALDDCDFWSYVNEVHFIYRRAEERRSGGLPC